MKNRTKIIIGGAAAGTLMTGAAAGLGAVLAARSGLRRLREHRLRELRGQTVLITGGSRGLGWRWRKSSRNLEPRSQSALATSRNWRAHGSSWKTWALLSALFHAM